MAPKISVTILTKNSSLYMNECLSALLKFDEIIILDNGSTDDTIEIARSYKNVKVYEHEFIGFGPLKNLAISYTSNDWVFSVDSDEIISNDLVIEIQKLILDKNCIYSISRDNYYNGKLIQACGWQNDFVHRLFNKTVTQFNDKLVHESLIINNNIKMTKLVNNMKHYTFNSAIELVDKMQKYSTLWANENRNKKKSSPSKAFFRAMFSFVKNYFFQKGFLYGYEGLVISISNANGVFYKYIKLYEVNKNDV